jgi:hypothetical protein
MGYQKLGKGRTAQQRSPTMAAATSVAVATMSGRATIGE